MRGNIIQLDLTSEQLDEAIAQWKARNSVQRTNADRIRAMSDEELAEWLDINLDCGIFIGKCPHPTDGISCIMCWREWMKQEAKE